MKVDCLDSFKKGAMQTIQWFVPDHKYRPPELHIISFINQYRMIISQLSSNNIVEIINSCVFDEFEPNPEIMDEIYQFYKEFENITFDKMYEKIFVFKETWDMYALSKIMLEFFPFVKGNAFSDAFETLLKTQCSDHPLRRFQNIEQMNLAWCQLLKTHSSSLKQII
jgi:hypothetical protein